MQQEGVCINTGLRDGDEKKKIPRGSWRINKKLDISKASLMGSGRNAFTLGLLLNQTLVADRTRRVRERGREDGQVPPCWAGPG